jgi:hypothetical protein
MDVAGLLKNDQYFGGICFPHLQERKSCTLKVDAESLIECCQRFKEIYCLHLQGIRYLLYRWR